MPPTPQPQAPNPGPAPFQQANQGLAAARQGGGGPSPVAALVAATRPKQRRQGGGGGGRGAPRVDTSGIQQAGSAIGQGLRQKYQREWEEKQATVAHKRAMERQEHLSGLQAEVGKKATAYAYMMENAGAELHRPLMEAEDEVADLFAAMAAQRINPATGAPFGLPPGQEQLRTMAGLSPDLLADMAVTALDKRFELRREAGPKLNAFLRDIALDAGTNPDLFSRDSTYIYGGERDTEAARQVRERHPVHGEYSNDFPTNTQNAMKLSSDIGIVAVATQSVDEDYETLKRMQQEIGNQAAQQTMYDNVVKKIKRLSTKIDHENVLDREFAKKTMGVSTKRDGEGYAIDWDGKDLDILDANAALIRDRLSSPYDEDIKRYETEKKQGFWASMTAEFPQPTVELTPEQLQTWMNSFFVGENSETIASMLARPTTREANLELASWYEPKAPQTDELLLPKGRSQVVLRYLNAILKNVRAVNPKAGRVNEVAGDVTFAADEQTLAGFATFLGIKSEDFTPEHGDAVRTMLLQMTGALTAQIEKFSFAGGSHNALDMYSAAEWLNYNEMIQDGYIQALGRGEQPDIIELTVEVMQGAIEYMPFINQTTEEFERSTARLFNSPEPTQSFDPGIVEPEPPPLPGPSGRPEPSGPFDNLGGPRILEQLRAEGK